MDSSQPSEEPSENGGFKNTPLLKTTVRKSKDKRWIIHETIITDIKPVKYFQTFI